VVQYSRGVRLVAGVGAACVVAFGLGAGVDIRAQSAVVEAPPPVPATSFDIWLTALRAEALAHGITQQTVDEALGAIEPIPVVVQRDRTQAELTLTLDQYLRRRLTATFVRTARAAFNTHRPLLRQVETQFGVPANVVVAIWGLESNFGRFTGSRPVVAALVTLAFDGRRAALFRKELLAALTILDRREVDAAMLKGSWAGAMGQPQFMPSSYLEDAVDFDGDGRRDIWRSTPDVLASIAKYVATRGWKAGERWGREVVVRDRIADRVAAAVPLRLTGPCQAVRDMTEPRPLHTWDALGVRLKTGGSLPTGDVAASLVRVDRHTYLVYANYEALLAYNCAHTYALSVALLADRIR
jgi:membrane-bound lytic murein transglycosylase B